MKMHALIAVLRGQKNKITALMAEYKELFSGRYGHLTGQIKTWSPAAENEEGEESPHAAFFPHSVKKLVETATGKTEYFMKHYIEYLKLELARDYTNSEAVANLAVGDVKFDNIPATALLTLQRELTTLQQLLQSVRTLDPSIEWHLSESGDYYRTESQKKATTRKEEYPMVLSQATEKHQATVELRVRDIHVGWWNTIDESGCWPVGYKSRVLGYIDTLIKSIEIAVSEANQTETVTNTPLVAAIHAFIFQEELPEKA